MMHRDSEQRVGSPTPAAIKHGGSNYRSLGALVDAGITLSRRVGNSAQVCRQGTSGSEYQQSGGSRREHPAVEHPAGGVRISCKPDRQNGCVARMLVMVHTPCKLLTPLVHLVYALCILCILVTPNVHFVYSLSIQCKHSQAVSIGTHRFAHRVHTV
jgi:hypothetical protein